MCFAVECHVRYDLEGIDGETREERNARFGRQNLTPVWEIPDAGSYLWDWYFAVSNRNKRVIEGVAQPLPWREFIAWAEAMHEIVTPFEYDILAAMDSAYVAAVNAELESNRAAQRDKAEQEAGQSRGSKLLTKRGRR